MSKEIAIAKPLHPIWRATTFIDSPRLCNHLGLKILIASETFQQTGSFKFRAAYNLAANIPEKLLITASSGNFGQALAWACRLLNKSCIVVMPESSAQVKIDATRAYGARVELVNTSKKSRAERVKELSAEFPAGYVASAYDDPLVIAGNASLGQEIAGSPYAIDCVVSPIGGGGLSSGIILGIASSSRPEIKVIGAEPLMANDAAQSLRSGMIVSHMEEPGTIADGARTISVGKHNWEILKNGLEKIIEVPEENILEATRLLFSHANLKTEPTGALSLGAVLTKPTQFSGKTTLCVVSGGNVDPSVFCRIITGA